MLRLLICILLALIRNCDDRYVQNMAAFLWHDFADKSIGFAPEITMYPIIATIANMLHPHPIIPLRIWPCSCWYTTPDPIQTQMTPDILAGHARSQLTGTKKKSMLWLMWTMVPCPMSTNTQCHLWLYGIIKHQLALFCLWYAKPGPISTGTRFLTHSIWDWHNTRVSNITGCPNWHVITHSN